MILCFFLQQADKYYSIVTLVLTSTPQVIILDVRVPSVPVARLGNHRAPINGITWAPHSSCHVCTAGQLVCKQLQLYYTNIMGLEAPLHSPAFLVVLEVINFARCFPGC